VTAAAVPDPPSPYSRALAWLTLAALAALIWLQPPWLRRVQAAWFDSMQAIAPRQIRSMPVTIVAIDDKSLAGFGQWPWPRTVLADLIAAIDRHQPAAIGLDVLMPEADRLSTDRLLDKARLHDPALAQRLASLPSNDAVLAEAVAAARVVLVASGTRDVSVGTLRAAPVVVSGPGGGAGLPRYAGVIANIDIVDAAAAGHGIISVEPTDAVFRRFPLVVDIDGTLAPSLATEMLRVALHEPSVRLSRSARRVKGISVGDFTGPTEADGAITLYYSHGDPRRYVSATDLLAGRVDPEALAHKLVLIGVTGSGLRDDYRATPLGEPMPGSELHAQLLENLFDRSYLRRPPWGRWLELAVFVALGALLVHATPRWRPQRAALLAAGSVLAIGGAAQAAFRSEHLLFDATPAASLLLLFGVLLVITLTEAARRRRRLERLVQAQREQAAFVKGELDAAQRIQAGMLPSAEALNGDPRVDLHADMTPARVVGGDLYDFFFVDADRLFFLVGDVAGKGLSASLFMAVSKALCKSIALRAAGAPIGAVMTQTNAEVSRDNAAMLFVTAFIGVLDLESGELTYCNAGHDDPYALHASRAEPVRLRGGDGPGLCVIDDFEYRGAAYRLEPGEMLCIVTDGIVEAQDAAGGLYGSARLAAALERLRGADTSARGLVEALRVDVAGFVGEAEPADDLTVLALRWNGPRAVAGRMSMAVARQAGS
jgi:serine phosphatase RsbU (regulator of sigma subunit)/CHASE2 domain-containing sensor protein